MNNDINEDYCSLDVSKLLKEKGFDVWCKSHYELALTSKKNKQDGYSGPFGWKKGELNIQSDNNNNTSLSEYYNGIHWFGCSRPTHTMAIKWIRKNFKIEIDIRPTYVFNKRGYQGYIHKKGEVNPLTGDMGGYVSHKTPEEATEAALLYTLKKLI